MMTANSLNVSLINGKLKEEFLREIKCRYPNIKVQIPTKGPISNSIKVVDLLSPSTNFRANKTISNAIKPPKYPKATPNLISNPYFFSWQLYQVKCYKIS